MAKTTELEAVNEMLTAVGTIPVSTLAVASNSDAAIALDTLRSVQREVESQGWWFNTSNRVPFAPTGGQIPVPANVLSLRPARGFLNTAQNGETRDLVERNGYVFDRTSNTQTINSTVYLDVVYSTDFELLPESVRRYVTVRAARIFQTKILGDETLGLFTEMHELQAWQTLESDAQLKTQGSTLYLQRAKRMAAAMTADPVASVNQQQQRGR